MPSRDHEAGFDPYPFILLTLALSLQASYAAPLILLAQNPPGRAGLPGGRERDRRTSTSHPGRTPSTWLELAAIRLALGEMPTRDYPDEEPTGCGRRWECLGRVQKHLLPEQGWSRAGRLDGRGHAETGRPLTASVRRNRSRVSTSRPRPAPGRRRPGRPGRAEGSRVRIEQLGEIGRDRILNLQGAQVLAEGAVGVAGRGRVLKAGGLLRPGPAVLDGGGLGGWLSTTARSVRRAGRHGRPGWSAHSAIDGGPTSPQATSMMAMVASVGTVWPSLTSRPDTVPAWWAVTWFSIFMA